MSGPFVGPPGRIWAICYQAMTWLQGQLAASSAPQVLETPVQAVFATLWNGLKALSVSQISAALAAETQALIVVDTLPLGVDPVTAAFLAARLASCSAAATQIAALMPALNLFTVGATLATGVPAIADTGFLEWTQTFAAETPPAGMVLPGDAVTAADAWTTIANAVFTLQGSIPLAAFDTATRQFNCASAIATVLGQTQSGGFASAGSATPAAWSTVVALPTLLLDAAVLSSAPASLASQQASVIRYVLMQQVCNLANLLLSFRSNSVVAPSTARLYVGESLMDLAARTTGNFELWQSIAALNNLEPPYPSAANTALALTGQQLFLSGTGLSASSSNQPSYAVNVLGRDWDFGPINGTMPAWLGDVPMIAGLYNFARAIGRRLQTPLGSLVFHQEYGCSIPGEIGAVQTADEAGKINAYGVAAIKGDPRTGTVSNATTAVSPGFQASFSAAVSPVGPGQSAVNIAEVIGASR